MIDQNNVAISESEEMYLITIARLVEQGVDEPVPISRLASELAIQPVSANQMIHKLSEEDLVTYQPYKGVQLSRSGQEVARQVLRDRRLWEFFLVNHLEMAPSEADALACRLEHITPEGVTCLLAKYLGHPTFSPQGAPIPKIEDQGETSPLRPMNELPVDSAGEVVRIECDESTVAFLESDGIRPGATFSILGINSMGGILFEAGGKRIHISHSVAACILTM
jgi:DtxR family Mn-dependent transcriptional regulator